MHPATSSRVQVISWFVCGLLATLLALGLASPQLLLPAAHAEAGPACMDDGDYGQVGGREDPMPLL
jgi:hypothetical protein